MDAQVAAVAGKVGSAQLDRLVAEAIKRFDLAEPDRAADPEDGYLGVHPRHATVHGEDVHFAGTVRIEAEIDMADAFDLENAVAHGAAAQKALGSEASLDARRARSARRPRPHPDRARPVHPRARGTKDQDDDSDRLPAAREVVLHAHFDASIQDEQTIFGSTGRLEERQRLLLLDQLKSWCADSCTKITIKPVIDLNASLSTPAYKVPDLIREQIILRDRTCVFPWCTRPARSCDVDHIIEFDHDADTEGRPQPGPTATWNLGALCRFHHRLKTHSAWHYEMTEPGVFIWTSPHGHHYRRDQQGTTAITTSPPGPAPPRQHRP